MSWNGYPSFHSRPTFVEINSLALIHNIKAINNFVKKNKKVKICAIVKSNAYGHGLKEVAKIISEQKNVEFLGITSIEEGILLRDCGVKKPILLLGSIFPFENFKEIISFEITPTIASIDSLRELNSYAQKYSKKISFHLKIDTGMGRIGILPDSITKFVEEYKKLKNVVCEGIYTHFSSAKEDKDYTLHQITLFKNSYEILLKNKIKPKWIHTANSAACILYPESYFNMIRPGLIIYGMKPFEGVENYIDIKPVLSLKSKIVFIKVLPKGRYISYSKTYKTTKKTKIATIPIGYADGILRKMSNRGKVIIQGRLCDIIGRVTMDMIMVDVTGVKNPKVGDEVILIGQQLNKKISIEKVAEWCETINYEIATLLSLRIPRVVV